MTPEEEQRAAAEAAAAADPSGYASRVKSLDELRATQQAFDEARFGPLGEQRVRDMFNEMDRQRAAENSADAGQSKTADGRVVSLKPDWYTASAPTHTNTAQKILDPTLSAFAAGTQRMADASKGTPVAGWQQGQANFAALANGIGSAFLNSKQNDEDRDLQYALKQAEMFKALNPRAGEHAGSKALADALRLNQAYAQLGMGAERAKDVAQRGNAAQQRWVDQDSAGSPISLHSAQTAASAGWLPQDQTGKVTQNELKQFAPFALQDQQHRFQVGFNDYKQNQEAQQHADQVNQSQTAKVADEARQRAQSQVDAQIPGVEWMGGPDYVPPSETRKEVQQLVASRESSLGAIRDIKAATQYFQNKYGNDLGSWYAGVRQAIKTGGNLNLDPEDQAYISKIQLAKDTLGADQRIRNGMKAPQGVELKMMNELLNSDSSIGGILFPEQFYNGLAEALNLQTGRAVTKRNARFSDAPVAPNPNIRATAEVQPQHYYGGGEQSVVGPRPFSVPQRFSPDATQQQQPAAAQQGPGAAPAPAAFDIPTTSERLQTAPVDARGGSAAMQDARGGKPAPKTTAEREDVTSKGEKLGAKPAQMEGKSRRYTVDLGDGNVEVHELTDAEADEIRQIPGAKITAAEGERK